MLRALWRGGRSCYAEELPATMRRGDVRWKVEDGEMKIVVTGGTGFIGRALVEELSGQGHEVVVLTRKSRHEPKLGVRFRKWDAASSGSWQEEVASADAVVNLAGGDFGCLHPVRKPSARTERLRSQFPVHSASATQPQRITAAQPGELKSNPTGTRITRHADLNGPEIASVVTVLGRI